MIHIVRKYRPSFTTSPRLVLIRLVWTEIQPIKNIIEINKEMYGPYSVRMAIHFFVNYDILNGCILITIGSIYTKLGNFVKLGLYFLTMWINSC